MQIKMVKDAMMAAMKEAQACCEGLQSVLESRLAVCLPAIAEACADIVTASPHDTMKHEACSLLSCGLHQLHQVPCHSCSSSCCCRRLHGVQAGDAAKPAPGCVLQQGGIASVQEQALSALGQVALESSDGAAMHCGG